MKNPVSQNLTTPAIVTGPNVDHVRREIQELFRHYELIQDCIDGEQAVKDKREFYLPVPNPDDNAGKRNWKNPRYESYLLRAVFYNATKRTLKGLVGQIFMRDPLVKVPTAMQVIVDDSNGAGIDLTQTAKMAAAQVIAFGRSGIFTDYPSTDGIATKADIQNGNIRPTVTLYSPWRIINWRTIPQGGKQLLSLVVLQEEYCCADDGFKQDMATQYRVLALVNGAYVQYIYQRPNNSASWQPVVTINPTDGSGKPMNTIPFMFIGSENNDPMPDAPPLYDLASLNISHYRNSADYEEGCFLCGQPTLIMTGLDENWVQNVLKGTVAIGSRSAIPLPANATAELLQAASNTMIFEAMQHKEKQMTSLGAKLVEQQQVQRTATEANIDETSETSTLASSAQNVAVAIKQALVWAAQYMNLPENEIDFSLNTEFDLVSMSAQDRAQLLKEWQSGGIAWEEYRENLHRAGIATMEDDKAKLLIEQETAEEIALNVANGLAANGAALPLPAASNNVQGAVNGG